MSEERFQTTGWDGQQVKRQPSASAERTSAGAAKPKKKKRRKRRRGMNPLLKFLLWIIFVVTSSAILAGVGWLLANDLCAFKKDYIEAEIVIVEEDTAETIAQKLKEGGLVEYEWFFRLFSTLANLDTKIEEGRIGVGPHTLNTDMDYRALIAGLYGKKTVQQAETVKITVPEGYTVQQIIDLLAEKKVNTAEALTEAAKNYKFEKYTFIDNENLGDIRRLEGYLYPDTYDFFVGENPANALSRFLENFNNRVDSEMIELMEERGQKLNEVLIVASLIEKETDGTDRQKISSVIYNRINNPSFETAGFLQIDAALVYATGKTELTEEDKSTNSPYNLYLKAGLPPTPICNPGRASILAALKPEDTNYYYYVLGADGKHIYSSNYRDHVNVINSLK